MTADKRTPHDFERAAGGLDFDDPIREHAHTLGENLATEGPEAIFEQIEELVPEQAREVVAKFPLTAILVGVGVGIFLGMKKGDDLLAAGSAMLSAAATANIAKVMGES